MPGAGSGVGSGRRGAGTEQAPRAVPATAVVIGLSVPWFRSDPRHGEYYTLLVFSALGAILLAGATDLKEFVVAMILSSATGYVLVGYHRLSSPGSEAAIKYYLIGAFVSAGMLIGGLSMSRKIVVHKEHVMQLSATPVFRPDGFGLSVRGSM